MAAQAARDTGGGKRRATRSAVCGADEPDADASAPHFGRDRRVGGRTRSRRGSGAACRSGGAMLSALSPSRIWLSTQPTDMRCSFDGLSARVRRYLGEDPTIGHWFELINRRWTMINILEQSRYAADPVTNASAPPRRSTFCLDVLKLRTTPEPPSIRSARDDLPPQFRAASIDPADGPSSDVPGARRPHSEEIDDDRNHPHEPHPFAPAPDRVDADRQPVRQHPRELCARDSTPRRILRTDA